MCVLCCVLKPIASTSLVFNKGSANHNLLMKYLPAYLLVDGSIEFENVLEMVSLTNLLAIIG